MKDQRQSLTSTQTLTDNRPSSDQKKVTTGQNTVVATPHMNVNLTVPQSSESPRLKKDSDLQCALD